MTGNNKEDENRVQITVQVPESVRDAAKEKLEHGGMSQEVRDTLTRVAFGEDINQRSRLESRLESLRDERDELREERRELDAEIENIDSRIDGIEKELSQLSSKEERYEAKLESLEYRIRGEGRIFSGHSAVQNVAKEAQREPEGVIKDLKDRNPDVPDYAFEDGLHDYENDWNGFDSEDIITRDVDDREARYR